MNYRASYNILFVYSHSKYGDKRFVIESQRMTKVSKAERKTWPEKKPINNSILTTTKTPHISLREHMQYIGIIGRLCLLQLAYKSTSKGDTHNKAKEKRNFYESNALKFN